MSVTSPAAVATEPDNHAQDTPVSPTARSVAGGVLEKISGSKSSRVSDRPSSSGRHTAEYDAFCSAVDADMESPKGDASVRDLLEASPSTSQGAAAVGETEHRGHTADSDTVETAGTDSIRGLLEFVPSGGGSSPMSGLESATASSSVGAVAAVGGDEWRRGSNETAVAGSIAMLGLGSTPDVSRRDSSDLPSPIGSVGRRSVQGKGGYSGRNPRDSIETAGAASILGLLESTPSPGGGLDQSVADGSALRGKKLAKLYDGGGGGGVARGGADATVRPCAVVPVDFW